jgi:hypothetical protein
VSGSGVILVSFILAACSGEGPTASEASRAHHAGAAEVSGPTTDLNVRLVNAGRGEGFIKFRQQDDGLAKIYLGTKIEGLDPDHDYFLQRAALTLGSGCVNSGWLTLGLGTVVTPIHTNAGGVGRADLFRNLPATLIGVSFDIHFQIIDAVSGEVVLESDCYQYIVSGD